MLTIDKPIESFEGLATQSDISQVALGSVVNSKNMAILAAGKLARIPGITALGTAVSDASSQIPVMVYAKDIAGVNYTYAVYIGSSVKIINMTTGTVCTGPALTSAFGQPWTTTWYSQKYLIAGGGNPIQQIDTLNTHSNVLGTLVPTGNLVQSFLDRLYVADIDGESGLVYYSDILLTDFSTTNVVNVKEIPGNVTALAINSPSTQSLGISTQLLIFKETAFWAWDESSKQLVSSAIGTLSPHSIKNTAAGTIFLGNKEGIYSVYLLAVGTTGEPTDIGEALYDIFNGATKLANPILACAERDGHFYKLFFSLGSETTNPNEIWLDIDTLTLQKKIRWYGVHTRGEIDSVLNTGTRLELAQRGALGSNVWFRENSDVTADFNDTSTATMTVELNLPLNVEPATSEKQFDTLELLIAPNSNTAGNQIVCEVFADEVSVGSTTVIIYDESAGGVVRVFIPLRGVGRTGMAAIHARLKITHLLDTRLDVLGAVVHYLANEDDVSSETTTTTTTW